MVYYIQLLCFQTLSIVLFLFKIQRFGNWILSPTSGLNKNRTIDNVQKHNSCTYLHNYFYGNRSSKIRGKYVCGELTEKDQFINIATIKKHTSVRNSYFVLQFPSQFIAISVSKANTVYDQ
jgi:hypothetical protein